jgi:hypothetical protein
MREHNARNISGIVNLRLPDDLQFVGLSGSRSGHKLFLTNALDGGIFQAIIAQTSKHKDCRVLERYHSASNSS